MDYTLATHSGKFVLNTSENTRLSSSSNSESDNSKYITVLSDNLNLFSKLDFSPENFTNQEQRAQLLNFVNILSETISSNKAFYFNKGNFKPLSMEKLPDKSILLEWIFPDFRIGFSFEPKSETSYWYLVSNKIFNEYSISGELKDMPPVLKQILEFVSINS